MLWYRQPSKFLNVLLYHSEVMEKLRKMLIFVDSKWSLRWDTLQTHSLLLSFFYKPKSIICANKGFPSVWWLHARPNRFLFLTSWFELPVTFKSDDSMSFIYRRCDGPKLFVCQYFTPISRSRKIFLVGMWRLQFWRICSRFSSSSKTFFRGTGVC